MQSTRRTEGGYVILGYSGEIDFHHSQQVRKDIMGSLDQGQHVLVNLSDVSYIDSSGIASLVQGLQHGKGKNLRVALVGVKDSVLKVLKLTRLDQVFDIHASVEAGMGAE